MVAIQVEIWKLLYMRLLKPGQSNWKPEQWYLQYVCVSSYYSTTWYSLEQHKRNQRLKEINNFLLNYEPYRLEKANGFLMSSPKEQNPAGPLDNMD